MQSFVEANIFNWLIVGTDAHAKNYALLLGAAAPYDSRPSTIWQAFCRTRRLTYRKQSWP